MKAIATNRHFCNKQYFLVSTNDYNVIISIAPGKNVAILQLYAHLSQFCYDRLDRCNQTSGARGKGKRHRERN